MQDIVKRNPSFWLLSKSAESINEYTFPSKDDILKYFLYLHRKNNETLQDTARVIAQKVITIWSKKGIPGVEEHNIIEKIKKNT